MTNDPANINYQETILRDFNLISVGIYQKHITQYISRLEWDFSKVDLGVEFADTTKLAVYFHPLYGSNGYIPKWLLEGEYSKEDLDDIMDIIDVYNEGLYFNGSEWREKDNLFLSLGWRENKFGKWPVFLENLFHYSRKYGGEDVLLIYNENNNALFMMLSFLRKT